MENNTNRFFYGGVTKTIYKQQPQNCIRFITRYEEKTLVELKRAFGDKFNFTKKSHEQDRDKTRHYKFDIIPYDNTTARDMVSCITVVVCLKVDCEKVKGIFTQKFKNVIFKKSNEQTYTLTVDIPDIQRGIFKTITQPTIEYPIAIVSLGRYTDDTGLTHLCLKKCGIPHKIFVEPHEYEKYLEWIKDPDILVRSNEDFSEKEMGSTPMRNFILDHYKEKGYNRVWMLDDNIVGYQRLNGGVKNYLQSSLIFSSVEQYIKQYDGIGVVSHNFSPFIREGDCRTVLVENGKSFSSMCLLTDGPRFKHKYQEDHFISIDYLLSGFKNLCFNHVLYMKKTSGTMKGGNMVSMYKGEDGYTKKANYMYNTLKDMVENGTLKLTTDINNFCKPPGNKIKSKTLHYTLDYKLIILPTQTSQHKPEVTFEKWDENFFEFEPYPSVLRGTEERNELPSVPETSPCRWFVGKTLTSEDVEELQQLFKNVEYLKRSTETTLGVLQNFIKDV